MGDAALSQDEIDSLLAGLDGGSSPAPRGGPVASTTPEASAFRAILDGIVGAQSQNISVITGLPVNVSSPSVDVANRDAFLREQPEEVLAVSVPFTGSLPGEHIFVLPKELALSIAANANHEEGLTELDDMAIATVQECVSNLTGTTINVLSEKTGNRGIQSGVAEGSFGPKAMARVPSGDMVRAVYQVTIGDLPPERMVEIFSLPFVRDVIAASGGGPAAQPAAQQAQYGSGGGMGQPGGGSGGGMQMGMMQQQSYGMPQGFPGGGGMPGQMQYGGYGPTMAPPNVQPVQFGSLQMGAPAHESGNIGLIMDVYMEMTVELGRTRKLIKEILGMGEGTIIELDKLAGEPVDILVNHKLIAKGEVVVIDENFGVRVTEIVSQIERVSDLG
ncbi:MAG TPA: flagellar motor switch protein FliN [Rectinemataceae bacterium]|nr:flagellar motor switch protein FliN [Rectinemataceae bacterium]